MDYIDIFRGSGYTNPGNWWSPNIRLAEMYKHGPLAGKMSKSKVSLEDFKKGVEKANTRHKATSRFLERKYPLEYKSDEFIGKEPMGSKVRPSAVELRKQFDLDYKNMPLDEFKNKYKEAILPNQPSKIAWKNTLKPVAMTPTRVLKPLAKLLGPLAIPLTVYDYLSGSPAGEGSDNPGTKHFDGKSKKR